MILRCFSHALGRVLGLALLASLAGGCGGESTDTGNPPVVLGQKLRLTATETGVLISGDAGAVPGGARVDVVNTATGQMETTTAAPDGSFSLEVEGTAGDEYRVYAASSGEIWRTRLTSSGATATEAGLAGLDFLLQSADGFTPVANTTLRLSFKETELGFSGGCNSYFGTYSLCDGKLCVSSLGSTDIGCEPALQAQDTWVSGFLQGSPTLTQAGPALTLSGDGATLELLDREVADPDRPLTGRTWTVDTFIDGDSASNFPGQGSPTLQFAADGSLTVFTTCNTGNGSYTRDGDTLTIAPVLYTEAGCGTAGSAQAEERVMQVMTAGEVTVAIDSARLTITRGTLGLGATTD